jgi:alcohol dehydrogenase class IV
MQFEFATASRILFGPGTVEQGVTAASSMGGRLLVVTGGTGLRHGLHVPEDSIMFAVAGEPTVDAVRRGGELARDEGCDVVVAIGGGSAIDAGKAIAALLTNPGDPLDYLEVIGRGKPLERTPAPLIAIPTTAGTGSEVTRNAVLGSPENRLKASLRSERMLPRLAVVDPRLAIGLPPSVTASTGLDALTQLIEPYVSVRANPMTDLFCVEGIGRAARALPRAWDNGNDLEARTDVGWAALLSGLALANAGLGAVHGFAAPIGGMFPAPHGAVCATLLPHVMAVNVAALRAREAGAASDQRSAISKTLERYEHVARLLTERPQATAEDGIRWVAELCRKLEIPPLSNYGVRDLDFPMLVDKAARASSMKGNPIPLEPGELREIVARAL